MSEVTRETLAKFNEEMDSNVNAIRSDIYELKESLDEFEERIDKALDILNSYPSEELNALLSWGLIPGTIVVFDGKRKLKFDGFTEAMRLKFIDITNQQEIYVGLISTYKNLDKFSKVQTRGES